MMMMEDDGEGGLLSLLSLFFPSPGGSNLWTMGERAYPCPSPCYHDLDDAVMHAGCHSLCSTCCTSLCTLSPTVDSCLFPSARALQDLIHDSDPSVHRVPAPEEALFGHQGCGSGILQESETETVTWTCRSLHPLLPSLLPGKGENVVSLIVDTRKTLNESVTAYVSVHNCARCVEKKESGGMTCHGNVNGSGIDWGSTSKTWIWI